MSNVLMEILTNLKAKNEIDAQDVLRLRAISYSDGGISIDEAKAIIELGTYVQKTCLEWEYFYCETLVDHLVHQQIPQGYVNENQAKWLIELISNSGRLNKKLDLELLIKIIENAEQIPESIKELAENEIEQRIYDQGKVEADDVKQLRRLLFALSGDGAAGISLAEAEMLFRIKDKTKDNENDHAWLDFFVKAIGNHLMAHNFYTPVSKYERARRDSFLKDTELNLFGFLGRLSFNADYNDGAKDWHEKHGDDDFARDEQVNAGENHWLNTKINADGVQDDYELAVLEFIKAA